MDLDLSFSGRTMCTLVYIKTDAKEVLFHLGAKRHSPGRPPKWVQQPLAKDTEEPDAEAESKTNTGEPGVVLVKTRSRLSTF